MGTRTGIHKAPICLPAKQPEWQTLCFILSHPGRLPEAGVFSGAAAKTVFQSLFQKNPKDFSREVQGAREKSRRLGDTRYF